MKTADLYIIAAGKGSRMCVNVPKALVRIPDEPCLTLNLRRIGRRFRRVFVVTNLLIKDQWNLYFESLRAAEPAIAESVINLPIRSGLGDGHATLEGLRAAELGDSGRLCDDIVVAWGDVLFTSDAIIDEMMSYPRRGSGILPAVQEDNPYVTLLVDNSMQCISADFARLGENRLSGLHDQSVFRFDRINLKHCLVELHNALWKNGRYICASGELSLLYSFHYFYNACAPAYVYETQFPTFSFNTMEEVLAIEHRTLETG